MTDLNEAVVEVLRLDAEATQGPWRWSPPKGRSCGAFIGVCSFGDEGGGWDMQTTGNPPEDIDAELIAYYRTAAPALAREVQRLQAALKRCRPSCVVCGGSVHSDRFCGDACYHKHYARLEEDDDAE